MATSYKPDGYNSASPYLMVKGAAQTIEFLQKVFGAELLRHYEREGGGIMHAEVRIDDTVIMLSDAADAWPAIESFVHIYVEDADAVFQKGIDAGASVVQEPVQKSADDDRRGGFKDPGGTTWWVATQA
ncbi:VOC family protein [Blastopirellula marina]|uniref:Extradiol dioxygenase n=1 Tax=Blastopirellula marina TaxID=124 RepID=A0A2S8GUW3_9BACT|nr:VOC family protein [Blastopirellula marina]PQO48210.1 extradiol dioxygenase [Blastopirellula marina]